MFRVKPPKNLVEEANKTAHARQAQQTAREEAERQRLEAEGRAKVTEIDATAGAKKMDIETAAVARYIEAVIGAGLTNEQVAAKLVNEALTNGTNPNTIVVASAAANGNVAGANPDFNMATTMSLFNMMMQRAQQNNNQGMGQPVQQAPVFQQQNVANTRAIDWDALDDNVYLTPEDSAALAAERGKTIAPGSRYPISMLTDDEKQRYTVAAQKGITR